MPLVCSGLCRCACDRLLASCTVTSIELKGSGLSHGTIELLRLFPEDFAHSPSKLAD